MVDMTPKTAIYEAMFKGTIALVVVTDTGSDLERESILASSRILGQTPEGNWELELTVSDEHGEPRSVVVVGKGVSFLDCALAADSFVKCYSDDPKKAADMLNSIRERGCDCGECYPKGDSNEWV